MEKEAEEKFQAAQRSGKNTLKKRGYGKETYIYVDIHMPPHNQLGNTGAIQNPAVCKNGTDP